jgi:glycopeptide antibiotics resistance protein
MSDYKRSRNIQYLHIALSFAFSLFISFGQLCRKFGTNVYQTAWYISVLELPQDHIKQRNLKPW